MSAVDAVLANPLRAALDSLSEPRRVPPAFLSAHITVIHKDGKDPTDCASYRPILLLNLDTKIHVKILASRLSPLLSDLIGPDQGVYQNNVTYIVLTGFPNLKHIKILFFLVLVFIYCVTISGNLVIVILYHLSKTLQSPMYLFITQLSLFDIILSTDILPNLLYIILHDGCTMSLAGCIIQFSFFAHAEASECFLLTVMSYDRYLAICKPLHYNSIMNQSICIKLVIIIWLLGFKMTLVNSMSLCSLYYCGPNIIHHFFCDYLQIIELSCSDTSWIHIQTYLVGLICVIAPFIIIVISYICIVITILKIKSNTGRKKAFTTCSSHLTVVCIFFGTLIAVYMFPTKGQLDILSKVLSLFYTIMTPLLNPIIYTFRNKDFKKAIEKIK
ncbi:olfactory receptor 154-like [Rana temporaria]|uniref:olfactory receptor 154-like n=1 Tax=Rana temporaria TaxID=8407 RepID=UPI001AAC5DE5|nr:olfactory receptor 154-like [Rana temporaria]